MQAVGAEFFSINAPELVSEYYGESEQALCEVFDSARRSAPAVVRFFYLDTSLDMFNTLIYFVHFNSFVLSIFSVSTCFHFNIELFFVLSVPLR